MSDIPSWVADLRDPGSPRGLTRGFTWLGEDQARRVRAEWLDIWSQVTFEPEFHQACRDRLARCIPLAVGPSRSRRSSKTESTMTMVFDPERADEVAFSHSHAMPSVCWSTARMGEIDDLLAYYLHDSPVAGGPGLCRVVKPLDVEHPEAIANAIDALELWVDDAFWGSAHHDDPWVGVAGDLSMLSLSVYVQRFGEQDPDRFPALGCRTLWSRSTLRIEQHPRGLFVFELRFRPGVDARAISELNEMVGTRLPEDLPIDLAASLLRGGTLTPHDIDELHRRGESPFEALALTCASAPSAPHTIDRLRAAIHAHRDDDEVLGAIASLASSYHHDGMLFEIADLANDPLRGELLSFLKPS